MIKRNKWKLILSSLLILLPILFGICVRERLPDHIATHWGIDGKADGFSSPLTAILLPPLFLLILHWVGLLITFRDNRKNEQNKKILGMVFWIMPVISLFANGFIYAAALGKGWDASMLLFPFMGIMFILFGNYLPKCRRNRTIGIKISWTLANEENWNATHRFSGKVYVIIGVLCLIAAFLPGKTFPWISLALILPAVLIPVFYSYLYYRKQLRDGSYTAGQSLMTPTDKRVTIIAIILVIVTLAFCLVLCFTGDIAVEYGGESFTVQADYYDDLTLRYADIASIEYREADTPGTRVVGFGTPRLLLGWFRNEEFGDHTRYSYGNGGACVVIGVNGKTVVIGLHTAEETRAFYEELLTKTNTQEDIPA